MHFHEPIHVGLDEVAPEPVSPGGPGRSLFPEVFFEGFPVLEREGQGGISDRLNGSGETVVLEVAGAAKRSAGDLLRKFFRGREASQDAGVSEVNGKRPPLFDAGA